jgi:tagatose 1,6-diphosphate aldolase
VRLRFDVMNPLPTFRTEAISPVPLMTSPDNLAFGKVRLRFVDVVPGDAGRGFVSYYHFRILTLDDSDVGHINFRVGDTAHVRLYAGHIGFEIAEAFRGHGFALQACRAIAPLVRLHYERVVITCDPENVASKRTI